MVIAIFSVKFSFFGVLLEWLHALEWVSPHANLDHYYWLRMYYIIPTFSSVIRISTHKDPMKWNVPPWNASNFLQLLARIISGRKFTTSSPCHIRQRTCPTYAPSIDGVRFRVHGIRFTLGHVHRAANREASKWLKCELARKEYVKVWRIKCNERERCSFHYDDVF